MSLNFDLNALWCEKYRPTTLADLILSDRNREVISEFKDEIPNLLFVGTPGTGKTTAARIIINEVLGCNFLGTCSSQSGFVIRPIPQYLSHPIMNGLENMRVSTKNPLYRVMPLSLTTTPLLMSERQDVPSDQIVAWTNNSYDSRVFYTSLGCPDDFENSDFQRLLINAINWAI